MISALYCLNSISNMFMRILVISALNIKALGTDSEPLYKVFFLNDPGIAYSEGKVSDSYSCS